MPVVTLQDESKQQGDFYVHGLKSKSLAQICHWMFYAMSYR